MFNPLATFPPGLLAVLAAVLCVAGTVRGFTGFGGGMIFMPVAASLLPPAVAAATFLVIDTVVTLPLVFTVLRRCDWATVLPACLGAIVFVHFGAWLLATADVLVLRWCIFAIVAALLALLLSGWHLRSRPGPGLSFATGALSGVLGGVSQMSAPPVAAVWLSSSSNAPVVRANLIVFFVLAGLGTYFAYARIGFFTAEVAALLVLAVPVYGASLLLGTYGFKSSGGRHYRKAAYLLIALAALTSMPLLDPYLR